MSTLLSFAEEKGHKDAVFIENKGQWQENIFYKMELNNGSLFFEDQAVTYFMRDAEAYEDCCSREEHNHNSLEASEVMYFAYQAKWLGSNVNSFKKGNSPRSDYRNYIKGNDPSKWKDHVQLYKHIVYSNIYDGIDIEFYGVEQDLKYNWIVHPGSNPNQIITEYSKNVRISLKNGDLIVDAPTGAIIEKAPIVYQIVNGKRTFIPSSYVLIGSEVSFKLGNYDKSLSLIIDPTVEFSSYSGSQSDNWGFTATYDNDGNLYGAGIVFDSGYPITGNNIQNSFYALPPVSLDQTTDIGLSKFSADGTQLLYSTYIGGTGVEQPHSMIVNSQNEVIVFGVTASNNFPTSSNGYNTTHNGGNQVSINTFYKLKKSDIFIIKLNPQGSSVTGGTFFGGSGNDGINGNAIKNYGDKSRGEVAIDDQDNIYVASCTYSKDFPTSSGVSQTTSGALEESIIAKFNSNLSNMIWSTYYGGNGNDAAFSLTVAQNGDVYACGHTSSSSLTNTSGAVNPNPLGNEEGWVGRFDGSTGAHVKTTFVGTSALDQAFLIDSDKNNGIYVFGQSLGSYPVTQGVYSNPGSKQFIHKLNNDLSSTLFSTVVGSGGPFINIVPTAFNVDDCLNIMLSGWGGNTNSSSGGSGLLGGNTFNMPITSNAYQANTDGSDFYFMVLGNNASSLVYGSYFGGNQSQEHVDGGTSRFSPDGNIYQAVCAGCGSTNFPTTQGAYATASGSTNCNLGVIKVNFETDISAGIFVDWAIDTDTNCNTLSIRFKNTSVNANQYEWDLGNGVVSADFSPTGVYSTFGTYTVRLIATDTICDVSDTTTITFDHDTGVNPLASFDVNYVSCDLGREVTLKNNSQRGANYFIWDFGDGTTKIGESPKHNYNNDGLYSITLIAIDTTCNSSDTLVKQVDFEYDILPPIVQVTANPCGDGSIAALFENDSAWYSYKWVFDDGTIEYGKYPEHKFTITNTYSIQLTIEDTLCNNSFQFSFTDYFLISENRLYIPNSFTPNYDDKNELFIISGNSCLKNSFFVILSSYGEEIFRTDKPFEEFWDGTYNGKPAQGDTYIYRFESEKINKNGYIVLYH